MDKQSKKINDNDNFSIRVLHNVECYEHIHLNAEISFCIKGRLKVKIENEDFALKEGYGVLIMPYKIHSYKSDKDTDSCIIEFDSTGIDELRNIGFNDTVIFSLSDELRKYIVSEKKQSSVYSKAILYPILNSCFGSIEKRQILSKQESLIQKVFLYVRNHYKEKISLVQTAKEIGYNPSYVSRVFSENAGIGFREFINRYRIIKSVSYIKRGDLTITQIALECGFDNLRTYNREFKKYFKITPSEYLKNGYNYYFSEREVTNN